MTRSHFLAAAFACTLLGASALTAAPKVDEIVLGRTDTGGLFDAAKPVLLANGKPVTSGRIVQKIVPAPVGGRWAAIVRTGMENGVATTALFVDGNEVPAGAGASEVTFSADGKHYAATCVNNAARARFVVHDGENLREYPQSLAAAYP